MLRLVSVADSLLHMITNPYSIFWDSTNPIRSNPVESTVCAGSWAPIYIVTYYIKGVTTSWTEGIIQWYCRNPYI